MLNALTTLPSAVLAQNIDLTPSSSEFQTLTGITITALISAAVAFVLIIAALVFFFMLILGGIRWITSGGDKGQAEAARNQITAALIGLVIVFAAYAIINLITLVFNVNILSLSLPTL